jgi:hypothetical protein
MASDDPPNSQPGTRPRVDDAVSLLLWREPARRLAGTSIDTRLLAAATIIAGVVAAFLFWRGWFAPGLAAAVVTLVLARAWDLRDPRQGWREIVTAGLPLLWWWAWSHGLAGWGRPLAPLYGIMVLWAAVGGAVADLAIARLFERRFGGVRLAAWQRFDTRFALAAAGASINLAILTLSLAASRPDAGLVAVAWWTIATMFVRGVRLAQANEQAAGGATVKSWLDQ